MKFPKKLLSAVLAMALIFALSASAFAEPDLEQVTGGKTNMKKNKDIKGKKITAAAGGRAAMEAEADVKGYAEAKGGIW